MHVIATAGHVDHGKSALIQALTGADPDRWAEEKRRGLTIDLGYAWTTLADGTEIAFVDVPGHQRFVTNMLAGIGPVPAVLFVVAADRGWSAQSAEHLYALDALQVRHGVLALTRSDLGDPELAEEEARDYLAGTTLEGIDAVAVSSVTGHGLDAVRAALQRMTARLPAPSTNRTRLWVDRVFTVHGAGTVVTGTLSSGTIMVDQELQAHPSGAAVRVRGLESLKHRVNRVDAVARVAINLRGAQASELRRGDALSGPGEWASVREMDVRLTGTATVPEQVVLHMGSVAVPVRVRPLGADTARLTLSRPLPTVIGERGVLLNPGAPGITAAVTVLDTLPPALRRRGAARRRAAELTMLTGEPDPRAEVRRRGAVRQRDLVLAGVPCPEEPSWAVSAEGWLIDKDQWGQWQEQVRGVVDEWAQNHPLGAGMSRRSAVTALELPDPALLDSVVDDVDDLVIDSAGLHRRDHRSTLPPLVEAQLNALLQRLATDPFDAPDAQTLADTGLTEQILAVATREGRLVRIAPGLYLRPEAVDRSVELLAKLPQPFSASDARQAFTTSRRVAVPLLEFLDRAGYTRRIDPRLRAVLRPSSGASDEDAANGAET